MTLETITTILTIIFGGTTVWQFIFFRNERRKREAEASALELENKKTAQELQRNECDHSSEQVKKITDELSRLQNDYIEMFQKVQENLKVIGNLQTTVADLKVENTFLKGVRCYRTSCDKRLRNKRDIYDDNDSTTEEDRTNSNMDELK